mgnify:CR=1 FL=1
MSDDHIVFNTNVGVITGWRDRGVIRATGIRYARAERFQPPVPAPPYTTPFRATNWSPASPQAPDSRLHKLLGASPLGHLTLDEHCQYLSVTVPDGPRHQLPVMVWIHGGSYVSGSGDATIFDARLLVEEQRVIVVHITYRLGLFGFLGGYGERAANLGLLDIMEALRWIKKNIDAFGGDANNITLFGQSSGGDAIAHLMIAEGVQGLFQRAIIQSAPLGISRGRSKMTAAMTAVASGIPATATVDEVMLHYDAVSAAARKYGLKAGMPFGVQYGHAPLPHEKELEHAWLHAAKQYDVLIGYAAAETLFFLPFIPSLQRITAAPLAGAGIRQLLVYITTGRIYRNAAIQFAKRHARGGGRAYLYQFMGATAMHTVDIPLLFGDKKTWEKAELIKGMRWETLQQHGKAVRTLWAQFARTGRLHDKAVIGQGLLSYRRM